MPGKPPPLSPKRIHLIHLVKLTLFVSEGKKKNLLMPLRLNSLLTTNLKRKMFALLPVGLWWLKPCGQPISCLLYTSDAADEEDSVDLGGRRIIKKKKKQKRRIQKDQR